MLLFILRVVSSSTIFFQPESKTSPGHLLVLPSSFDSRLTWPNCVTPIVSEGSCGASWAISTTSSLSDRFCIVTPNSTVLPLSSQYILDCDYYGSGCNGGYPEDAWNFIVSHGTVAAACYPYQGVDKHCPSTCVNGQNPQLFKAKTMNSIKGLQNIQNEIFTNGPVVSTMVVYQDLLQYSSGVYFHMWGLAIGSQSVKVVGWGSSGGNSYWICAGSWGTTWGMSGYFWIGFGQCEICEYVTSAVPSAVPSV